MLTPAQRQQAAEQLFNADTQRHLIPQLSQSFDGIELEDAYAIQDLWLTMRIDRGARLVGRKIGLTSRAMQMASNFNEPDYGYLFDTLMIPDGGKARHDAYCLPRVEVELAFIMGEDLEGSGKRIYDADGCTATSACSDSLTTYAISRRSTSTASCACATPRSVTRSPTSANTPR